MRIAIIGGGAAGIYSALLLKQDNPDYEIHLFEKEKKLGRKLCATGNGRCNLLNADLTPDKYNHRDVMKGVIEAYPFEYLVTVLRSFGVPLKDEDGYVYPASYSAVAYTDFLVNLLKQFGVVFHLETRVVNYEKERDFYKVLGENCGDFGVFDKLIITIGGESTPNLGSDGKSYPMLSQHGYVISPLKPGLCPIKIQNPKSVKALAGLRHEALVTGSFADKVVFSEKGEILYKEDGLSGIVIFNLESVLMRLGIIGLSDITVDLFPGVSLADLEKDLASFHALNPTHFLEAYFPLPLVEHVLSQAKLTHEIKKNQLAHLAETMKGLHYQTAAAYPFANSQVTIGGVKLDQVDGALQSKVEKGVYFAGEVLDIDGFCGGYNLSWALMSALIVSEAL